MSLVERVRTATALDPREHSNDNIPLFLPINISSFNVSDGSFIALVPGRSAVAIHTGALGQGSDITVVVNFAVNATTSFGEVSCVLIFVSLMDNHRRIVQNIYLVGSLPQLGGWNPVAAVRSSSSSSRLDLS